MPSGAVPFVPMGPGVRAEAPPRTASIPERLEAIAAELRRPGALPAEPVASLDAFMKLVPQDMRDYLLSVVRLRDNRPEGYDLDRVVISDGMSFLAGVYFSLVALRLGVLTAGAKEAR